jgi:polyisoprenoid-binding protein YceI
MTSSALQSLLRDGELAGSWTLDAARSEVRLKVRHMWGLSTITGVFRQFSGNGTVSATGEVAGVFTVDAGSIDTGIKKRDDHLRSADFFDTASHPDFTFAADGVTPAGEGVRVAGQLTVLGRTRPASFDGKASTVDGDVWLDGEIQVNRADFGLTSNPLGMGSMNVTIVVRAVFARQ